MFFRKSLHVRDTGVYRYSFDFDYLTTIETITDIFITVFWVGFVSD